jgi:hypothetical protein
MAAGSPNWHDPSYEEILQNLLARVRVHNPEWTNLNQSDPGVTMLELFAYLTRQLLDRMDVIPEVNRRAFLRLLGGSVRPAVSARGIVTFYNDRRDRDNPTVVTIAPDVEVRAGQIPFRTTIGLDALPVDALVCYKRKLAASPGTAPALARLYGLPEDQLQTCYYETTFLEEAPDPNRLPVVDLVADTVDHSLWIALRARPKDQPSVAAGAIANRPLSLGLLPAPADTRVLEPARGSFSQERFPLLFEIITAERDPVSRMPIYQRLPAVLAVNVLLEPGVVQISLPDQKQLVPGPVPDPLEAGTGDFPPLVADEKVRAQIVTWLRVRFPMAEVGPGVHARLNWAGINADLVLQQVLVSGEQVGLGTGEPNQRYTLVNKPVVPGSVRLLAGEQPWEETDDILTAGPELPLRESSLRPGLRMPATPSHRFQLLPETGELLFGDGLRGARPQRDRITVSYAYGGGRAGNVDAGQITKAPSLPPSVKVRNPVPTWGGLDAQPLAEAERQLSGSLKHRDRLVTADDFTEVIRATPGVALGRVEVLPLMDPGRPGETAPGSVTVLVVPATAGESGPPEPGRELLDRVCAEVDARRLLTTAVYVRGPAFVPLSLFLELEAEAGRSFPVVREEVRQAVQRFLSPATGGHSGKGWPLAKPVRAKELLTVADRVSGVAFATRAYLLDAGGQELEEVAMTGLQLPWPAMIDIRQGGLSVPASMAPTAEAPRRMIAIPVKPAQ